MAEEILIGLVAGIKIAVFIIVAIYSQLADIPFRKKGTYWINLMAIAFIILALGEFLHFVGEASPEYIVLPWIMDEENLQVFTEITYLFAAAGIFFFLRHIKENIKDYRSTFL